MWKRGRRCRKASYRSVVKRICMQKDLVTARGGERGRRGVGGAGAGLSCLGSRCRGRGRFDDVRDVERQGQDDGCSWERRGKDG